MSYEEINRKMQFIVDQQAQFTVNIQQLQEIQVQTEQVVARLAYATLEGFKDVNVKIDSLVDSQIRTEENLRKTDEQLQKTDELQRKTGEQQRKTDEQLQKTDERLRKLIAALDRRRNGGRNGPQG